MASTSGTPQPGPTGAAMAVRLNSSDSDIGPPQVGYEPGSVPAALDRALFSRTLRLLALRIAPKKCNPFLKRLRHAMLAVPKTSSIVTDPASRAKPEPTPTPVLTPVPAAALVTEAESAVPDAMRELAETKKRTNDGPSAGETQRKRKRARGSGSGPRLFLLSPAIQSLSDLPAEDQAFVAAEGAEVTSFDMVLKYESWSAEQVIRALLPAHITEVTTAFESVGHIAHMNLRDVHLPYKRLIGQVILDKNQRLKTVVNKLSTIDNTFRFFQMELIAGEDLMETELRESGCRFRLNFAKVYWNSRLHHEHERIVKLLAKEDVVCDMFAGIGPFAMPACRKGCFVYANDLNPESYKWLKVNAKLNKVQDHVRAFNLDGRDFARHVVKSFSTPPDAQSWPVPTAYIMNLPAIALDFLDVFRGLFRGREADPLPMIHCYCFSNASDLSLDVVQRAEAVLGHPLEQPYSVHDVRDVAPQKHMMCLSFRLPASVAYEERQPAAAPAAPPSAAAE